MFQVGHIIVSFVVVVDTWPVYDMIRNRPILLLYKSYLHVTYIANKPCMSSATAM